MKAGDKVYYRDDDNSHKYDGEYTVILLHDEGGILLKNGECTLSVDEWKVFPTDKDDTARIPLLWDCQINDEMEGWDD